MRNVRFAPSEITQQIISKLAQEETGKRQYYRPVYSLHKWWARRPGAQFRSIILLATGGTDDLFDVDAKGVISEQSNYFRKHSLESTVILDPFMGGGTTLVEANRLGAKVIGCDINPVSFWIVRETLKPLDLERLESYFRQLEGSAGKDIRALYETTCVHCKTTQAETLYSFWVRYVNCTGCGKVVPLFKRALFNEGMSRNKPVSPTNPAVAFCPRCFALSQWHGRGLCSCEECGLSFDPQTGTYDQGYYTCPNCGRAKLSLIQTLKKGQCLRERLVALEYWCSRCGDRLYKTPDDKDLAKIEVAKREFDDRKAHDLTFPRSPILEGASSVRWRQHNYRLYYELFNARQLLAFNMLIDAIRAIPEEEYRNAFFTVFSNSLEYNNMMTPYNYPHRKLHHLFNYHAMPLTTTPVENAVWGVLDEGAGTFVNCYRRYYRAKLYCQKPFDRFKVAGNAISTVYVKGERIEANFTSSFEELRQTPSGAMLLCGDSAKLSAVPDKSVDFVITDPPYFDNIHYSELSNFFYVWLRTLVDHPYFTPEAVPIEHEAIVNAGMKKTDESYRHLLTSVFQECARVLKDEGYFIFTFHHTNWQAWWVVLSAVKDSGFSVVDSFPVSSEYKVNPHIRTKQALDMDLVLICEKAQPLGHPFSLDEVIEHSIGRLVLALDNGYRNKLFLDFMGELLKVGSVFQDITYDQFATALTRFDDLVGTYMAIERAENHKLQDDRQLELF